MKRDRCPFKYSQRSGSDNYHLYATWNVLHSGFGIFL